MRKSQFKWLTLIPLFFVRVSPFEVGMTMPASFNRGALEKVSSGTGAGI
jgi:hypothetical protein